MAIIKDNRIQRDLLSDKVVDSLRRMILDGDLPIGTRLVEDELATRLGVSRAPLREALGRLAGERLVDTQPGRGTYVKGLTADDVRDLFAIRTELEVLAARQAALRLQPGDGDELLRLTNAMAKAIASGANYVGQDLDIHRAIWRLSRNERLGYMLDTLIAPVEMFMRINADSHQDWPDVLQWHQALGQAIASGDVEAATLAMRKHQARALEKILMALKLKSESTAVVVA